MSLINCPECGKEISDKAGKCPNCGYPIQRINHCKLCGKEIEVGQEVCEKCMKDYEISNNYKTENSKVDLDKPKRSKIVLFFEYAFVAVIAILGVAILFGKNKDDNNENSIEVNNDNTSNIEENTNDEDYDVSNFSIKNKVLYEGNGITIKTDGNTSSGNKISIGIVVKNDTKKKIEVAAPAVSLNNIMTENNMYTSYVEVPSGKKGSFNISVSEDWLSQNNINSVKKFDFYFAIWKDNSFLINTDAFTQKTSEDDGKYNKLKADKLYSDNNMDIEYVGKDGNEYNFIIKNKTSAYADYRVEECSINGWSFDTGIQVYDDPIMSKAYSRFTISIDEEFMSKNNIDKIENMEFKIRLATNYGAKNMVDVVSKVIKLK